ncbi:MAG: hypothetical protein ACOY3P_16270 [Planctomycetota bacterium]
MQHQNQLFARYRECTEQLIREMPLTAGALGKTVADLPGWQAMALRFEAFQRQGGRPMLVATLFGPSGAGKSTIFRMLTGVPVPAGEERRPMTYACAVAVPATLREGEQLADLFPGFRVESLVDFDQLRDAEVDGDRLFCTTYDQPTELPLVLVDVPDFNTVVTENWDKAERMLDRAELVLFVVYGDAYADRAVIRELARCCRKAGSLAYLFTKTQPAHVPPKWQHLIELCGSRAAELGFEGERSDGQSLVGFLGEAAVYSSPFSLQPTLDDIQPLSNDQPSLESLLRGQDAARIVLSGLLESTYEAVQSCRTLLSEARRRREELARNIIRLEEDTRETAQAVAGSQFPAGRLLELAFEEANRHLHWSARYFKFPLSAFARAVRRLRGPVRSVFDWFRDPEQRATVRDRGELEQERLDDAVLRLIDHWRASFPEEATGQGMLSAERCSAVTARFERQPLPPPSADWESLVRTEIGGWCEKNRLLSFVLATVPDAMILAGLGTLVVDLMVSGGVLHTTIGLPALAGAGSAAAGQVLAVFGNLNLQKVAEEAYQRWRDQRTDELATHLRAGLAEELFRPWQQQLRSLGEPADRSTAACEELQSLWRELEATGRT